ncbi:MAG: TRAP transporter large permease [Quisquiliibacterium sp.]|jgi:C4-dicarboxylate transporter DctM subunit
MTPLALALLLFAIMLVLMALRVPIAVAMFAAGLTGYLMKAGWLPLAAHLKTYAYARFSSYDLSVIPLFLLMGQFATQGGLSRALFKFAAAVLGNFRGGLAMASVVACAAFGSVCGSSIATAATIGSVALPEMKRHGYSGRLATATVAAGGTLGILIPPSVILVVYAILTEQNIAKLFAAAFVPGLIAMLGYIIAIGLYVRLVPGHAPEHDKVSREDLWQSALGVWPIVAIFLVVFGGIYGGVFTPTEGASVGAAATFLTALLRREMNWPKFRQSVYATAQASAMIFMIFLGADMLNSALALSQAPNQMAEAVAALGWPPLAIVAGILVFYVLLGCVMDELSMILLTIPIFFPMVMALDLGMDSQDKAIWFGILVLMVVEIGLIAPPVGLNVYVVNGIDRDTPIGESYRGVLPFLASDVVRTALLLFFPPLSLYLTQFMR